MHGLRTFETLAVTQARYAAAQAAAKQQEANRIIVRDKYGMAAMLQMDQVEIDNVATGGRPTPRIVKAVARFARNTEDAVNAFAQPLAAGVMVACFIFVLLSGRKGQEKTQPLPQQQVVVVEAEVEAK